MLTLNSDRSLHQFQRLSLTSTPSLCPQHPPLSLTEPLASHPLDIFDNRKVNHKPLECSPFLVLVRFLEKLTLPAGRLDAKVWNPLDCQIQSKYYSLRSIKSAQPTTLFARLKQHRARSFEPFLKVTEKSSISPSRLQTATSLCPAL